MKERITNCEYCKKELPEGTTRKRFCSDKCRVYFNREKPATVVFKKDDKGKFQTDKGDKGNFKWKKGTDPHKAKSKKGTTTVIQKTEPKKGSLAWYLKHNK